MVRSHNIRIYPNPIQEEYLKKSCGISRFVYNWGLDVWTKRYNRGNKPNFYEIKKLFNQIKRQVFPFVMDVSKCVPEYALMNLDKAFKNLYAKRTKYPNFKKRKFNMGSFSISNDKASVNDDMLKLPKINEIQMSEKLRFNGKIQKYTVSWNNGKWFVSISVEMPDSKLCENQASSIGIDLGIKDTIVLSNGIKMNIPETYKFDKRINKSQRALARKQKGSENRKKNITELRNIYYKKICFIHDRINKITTDIAKNFNTVCIEDLHVKGMMKNHHLAKSIANSMFGEIRRQLEYKSNRVLVVGRFFPSSKICSNCGHKNDNLTLSNRIWICPNCNTELDRDINAAKNIVAKAIGELTSMDSKSSVVSKAIAGDKTLVEIETNKYANSVKNDIRKNIFNG